ncbi:MAG TPA: HD domain-containing protein [Patescibacteria group bacterium]|nr:HD domain-containing protein [Patescibacteria group bacterium]
MDINTLINTIKQHHPNPRINLIKKADKLLKESLKTFNFIEKKRLYGKAIQRVLPISQENARAEFICAVLFFDLVEKTPKLDEIVHRKLDKKVAQILKAFNYAKKNLSDQTEILDHSLKTAQKISTLKVKTPTICASLLHALPHTTKTGIKEIEKNFGKDTAKMIENFQKIKSIKVRNTSLYANHLREMILGMAKDPRVIMIKMCSNIEKLKKQIIDNPEKLKFLAVESLEILAPIADLLGTWRLRWQLEDYAFRILNPEEYKKIEKRFNVDEKKNRDKYIQKTKNILLRQTKTKNINCLLEGRFKHFYSIYRKMKHKQKSFMEICDVFALRVVTDSIDDCYRILGIIHNLWKPKQGRVKDYIANPKKNHYRSLHTTVFGLNGRLTEFQIRTKEMNDEAKYGLAAHWYYKNPRKKTPAWIEEILEKQRQYKDDEEFLNNFSSEILPKKIYIYTPKGEILSLPFGSTPIDFAYHIHTEIGHKCRRAMVNELPVKLNHRLKTNDVVLIEVDRSQKGPKPEWLDFVRTKQAKKKIESFFNQKRKVV